MDTKKTDECGAVAPGATQPFWTERRRRAARWILVAAWAGFIFFMSSNSDTGLNQGLGLFSQIFQSLKALQAHVLGPGVDAISSIAHFCEYTVLGVLLVRALQPRLPIARAFVLAIVCASLYGVTDEIHQLFVPGRFCDPADWLVDTLGATLGASLVLFANRHRLADSSAVGSIRPEDPRE